MSTNLTDDDLIPASNLSVAASVLPTDVVLISRDGESVMTATVAAFLTSVQLLGVPLAPTAAPGTGTTQIATTEFVQTLGANLQVLSERTVVGAYLYKLASPSAISFLKVNADNSVSTESAATHRTSLGLGTAALEAVGTTGSVVPKLDGANIWSVDQTRQQAGGGAANFAIEGEGITRYRAARYTANINSPSFTGQKARGTIAVPSNALQNDELGQFIGSAWTGATFTTGARLVFTVIAATPSTTDMQSRASIECCPAGSVTDTEVVRVEHATGLSMFGANPVIDQNRILRPRSYTIGTLPAVPATGLVFCSDLGGGGGNLESNGSQWCRPGAGGGSQVLATDAAFSLTPLTSPVVTFHTGVLTADRAITLSTTGVWDGARFRVSRTGGGAFNLTHALKNLATNQWAEFVYSGSAAAWKLSAYGTL